MAKKGFWPNLRRPVVEVRTLSLPMVHEHQGPITVSVVVLINRCLYIVHEDVGPLRAGQVLSRNLDLTRQLGHDDKDAAAHVFQVFDSLFDARRAFMRIEPAYRDKEIPELGAWRRDLRWLLEQSWVLDRGNPEHESVFVLRAATRVQEHVHDRNDEKVDARKRTTQAMTVADRRGQRNPGRIPLLCCAADLLLQSRTQAVRGIGRRMDWRTIVLEHYLDQLRSACGELRRSLKDTLQTEDFFVHGKRRAPAIRKLVERMQGYTAWFKLVRGRPFDRLITHAVREIEEAARLLLLACEQREGNATDQAKEQLSRTYRSLCVFEEHWRLEELLATITLAWEQKRPLSSEQLEYIRFEFRDIHGQLTDKEAVTGELLHTGFLRPDTVLDAVIQLQQCILDVSTDDVDLHTLRDHLKAACRPL